MRRCLSEYLPEAGRWQRPRCSPECPRRPAPPSPRDDAGPVLAVAEVGADDDAPHARLPDQSAVSFRLPAIFSCGSTLRATMATSAPSAPDWSAIAAPMPRLAPVTRARRPANASVHQAARTESRVRPVESQHRAAGGPGGLPVVDHDLAVDDGGHVALLVEDQTARSRPACPGPGGPARRPSGPGPAGPGRRRRRAVARHGPRARGLAGTEVSLRTASSKVNVSEPAYSVRMRVV